MTTETRRLTTPATGTKFRVLDGDKFSIEGYAAVFHVLSTDLGGFRERVNPNAFDRALREKHDVVALVDHDQSRIVGRTKSGTLKLVVDPHGLRVRISPPDTIAGRDLMASIRCGDIDQMSFEFRVRADRWAYADDRQDVDVRELLDLDLLGVSAVTYSADEQAEIDARSHAGVLDDAYQRMVAAMVA